MTLFASEKFNTIDNRIRCLLSQKSGSKYVFSHNYAKIKLDSYDSLPPEKMLTLRNVIILIKSVFNKDKNRYYYTCLEECSYQLAEK